MLVSVKLAGLNRDTLKEDLRAFIRPLATVETHADGLIEGALDSTVTINYGICGLKGLRFEVSLTSTGRAGARLSIGLHIHISFSSLLSEV